MGSMTDTETAKFRSPAADSSGKLGIIETPEPYIKKWVLWKRVTLAVGYCLIAWGLIVYGVVQLFS